MGRQSCKMCIRDRYNINLKSRVIPSEKVNFFIFFEKVENEYDKNRAGEMFLGAFLSC